MTVGDLIKKLSKLDQSLPVVIHTGREDGIGHSEIKRAEVLRFVKEEGYLDGPYCPVFCEKKLEGEVNCVELES